jgi:integrase
MGRRRKGELPRYRLHKQSGQAVVSLPLGNGKYRDVLLGPFDTDESKREYARVIDEWLAHGGPVLATRHSAGRANLTINELILAYWPTVEDYYRHPDGAPTQEVDNIRLALRRLRQSYGHTDASAFDSLALEALREAMIRDGLCRGRINKDVGRIKRLLKWATAKKLVPLAVYQGLLTVGGLRAGRSAAKETAPVRPVADAVVETTLPHLTPPVRAMVLLQRCTAMRPGEIVMMRGCDIDTHGPTWTYRPGSDRGPNGKHKTAWRGHVRAVLIGPRGQEVLRPWLRADPREYLFRPKDGRAAYNAERGKKRKSKVTPRQAPRQPKRNPKRAPRDRYTVITYDQAVAAGCRKAHCLTCAACHRQKAEKRRDWLARVAQCEGLKTFRWHPNQLRHSAATDIRREAGLDGARAVLGHRSPQVTEVYAELDVTRAAEVMQRLG